MTLITRPALSTDIALLTLVAFATSDHQLDVASNEANAGKVATRVPGHLHFPGHS